MILVVATDPAVHRLSRRTCRYLDAVVSEPEADALRCKSIDDLHVVSLDRGVPSAAIGVDQHCICVVEGSIVVHTRAVHHLRRPAAVVDLH